MYKIYITGKNKKIDATPVLLDDITYKTGAKGTAGILIFTVSRELDNNKMLSFFEGDMVSFCVEEKEIFCGYIFIKERTSSNHIKVTCYDQLRYLKNHDSYTFVNVKASDIIKKLAAVYGLQLGNIADTMYTIPYLLFENKTLMDMILTALKLTEDNTGKLFVLYDECGKLTLADSETMKLPLLLSSNGAILDYKYKTDIDSDTYNRVKIVKTERKSKEQIVALAEHKENQSRWGYLQYFEKVGYETVSPIMKQMAETILKEKNRVKRTLSINALGDLRVKGGKSVFVEIMGELDINISDFFMVLSSEHRFSDGAHTMYLELCM